MTKTEENLILKNQKLNTAKLETKVKTSAVVIFYITVTLIFKILLEKNCLIDQEWRKSYLKKLPAAKIEIDSFKRRKKKYKNLLEISDECCF